MEKKPPKLMVVKPPRTEEERLGRQRAAAEQAVERLREAKRHAEAARRAYDEAVRMAEVAELPGVELQEPPPGRDAPDWPGVVVLDYKEWWRREYERRALGEHVKRLKNSLHRFLRETKPGDPA